MDSGFKYVLELETKRINLENWLKDIRKLLYTVDNDKKLADNAFQFKFGQIVTYENRGIKYSLASSLVPRIFLFRYSLKSTGKCVATPYQFELPPIIRKSIEIPLSAAT